MEVNELFKQRSITACMKASYNTVTSDIRSLVKQTWVTHVPFAVLLAIVLYFLLPNKSLHDWGEANPMASFILQTIIYAATLVMAAVSFWHLLPHRQLCPQGEKRKPGKSLVRILRHFGGFLMTCFLGMMIVGIATFIAAVPTIILIMPSSTHSWVHSRAIPSACRAISPHSSSSSSPSPACSSSMPSPGSASHWLTSMHPTRCRMRKRKDWRKASCRWL